jgi:hypothetical protein
MADIESQHERFLWALDHVCAVCGSDELEGLETILKQAGSAWRVSTVGVPHLERRVPEGVAEVAEEIMNQSGEAGGLLAEAWRELYGISPSPSEAYRHAVRAVETAAHEVVSPDHGKATLGTMIGAMRDKPSNWTATAEGAHPIETVSR